jgi:hypothetical protein
MDVEDLLTRSLAICEKQVHSLTAQTAAPKGSGHTLSDHEHPTAIGLVEVRQPHAVGLRDDQHMTGVHRVQVAEGE